MQSYSRPFQPKRDEGWAFVVTLMRVIRTKNGQDRQSIRMEPYPPYTCKSALEARHWGATYALYRVRFLLSLYSTFEPVNPIRLSTSSAMAFNSTLFSLLVLVIIGPSLQLNIRRRRRTKVGCTMPIPLLRASP